MCIQKLVYPLHTAYAYLFIYFIRAALCIKSSLLTLTMLKSTLRLQGGNMFTFFTWHTAINYIFTLHSRGGITINWLISIHAMNRVKESMFFLKSCMLYVISLCQLRQSISQQQWPWHSSHLICFAETEMIIVKTSIYLPQILEHFPPPPTKRSGFVKM